MITYKINKVENRNLILVCVLALVITLVGQTVLADNEATQSASTSSATTILIRNVADDADVATITFPSGAPSAVISNPTGNSDVQVLTATASEAAPVALLTSTANYTLWYNVTSTATWGDAHGWLVLKQRHHKLNIVGASLYGCLNTIKIMLAENIDG